MAQAQIIAMNEFLAHWLAQGSDTESESGYSSDGTEHFGDEREPTEGLVLSTKEWRRQQNERPATPPLSQPPPPGHHALFINNQRRVYLEEYEEIRPQQHQQLQQEPQL